MIAVVIMDHTDDRSGRIVQVEDRRVCIHTDGVELITFLEKKHRKIVWEMDCVGNGLNGDCVENGLCGEMIEWGLCGEWIVWRIDCVGNGLFGN